MSCRRFRKLLYLYRPGELTEGDADGLARHLAGCSRCSAELRRIQAAEHEIAGIRPAIPVLTRPGELADAVTAAIAEASSRKRRTHRAHAFDPVLDVLFSRPVRFSFYSLALAAIALFVSQEFTVFKSISALGDRMAALQHTSPGVESGYTINAQALQHQRGFKELSGKTSPVSIKVRDGSLVIGRETLTQIAGTPQSDPLAAIRFLSALGYSPAQAGSLLRTLQQQATTVFYF